MVLSVRVLTIRIMLGIRVVVLDVSRVGLCSRHSRRIPVVVLGRHSLGRHHSSLVGSVLLHLQLETNLVFGGHFFVTLLVGGSQSPPAFAKDASHLYKLDSRKLLHYLGAHVVCKENVSTAGSLGSGGILGTTLAALAGAVIFDHDSASVVSRRRNIGRNLCVVAVLVFGGTGVPIVCFVEEKKSEKKATKADTVTH